MTYFAIITQIKELNPISGADKIQSAMVFGSSVIVGMDTRVGDVVAYFPCDGQLSHEFCHNNNLYRHSNLNKDPNKSGYFEDNRRVRMIKMRGIPSDGFIVPLEYFAYTKINPERLTIGLQFDNLMGKQICNKYITQKTRTVSAGNKARTSKKWDYPLFKEHFETEQLRFFLNSIPIKSKIIISEKLHGTSHRIANTLKVSKENIFDKILKYFGYRRLNWTIVNGTRRTILTDGFHDGYYGDDFRKFVDEKLGNLLHKGEAVYGEIVGWVNEQKPIMGSHSVEKLKNPEMVKRYGKNIIYSYGCQRGENDFYVYRITKTDEDGHEIEYSWDQVKCRCEQLGVKHVPELYAGRFFLGNNYPTPEEDLTDITTFCEILSNDHSTLDVTHIAEGVCLRVENEYGTKIYKHKSTAFKIMEDIMKADETIVDLEEAS